MARKPQSGTAKARSPRKSATRAPLEMPASARALDIDDLMGDFAAPPPVEAEADLDALLDMLSPSASDVPATTTADFDDLLEEITAPVEHGATPDTSLIDLDDLLGELASPTPAPVIAEVGIDDLLGELAEPDTAPPMPGLSALAAPPEGIDETPVPSPPAAVDPAPAALADAPAAKPARRKRLALPARPRKRAVLITGLGALFLASNALSYTLGTRSHPAAPPAPQAEHPAAPPATGILRYAGEGLDFRIDEKTIFEDDEFRAAVDELVGGPDVQGRIAAMLPTVRALEPVTHTGARLRIRACNPQSCGQENFLVLYDTANKRVSACITQPYVDAMTGEPTRASSWLYDEKGSREVPACDGFPHPAPATTPTAEASAIAESVSATLHHAQADEQPAAPAAKEE